MVRGTNTIDRLFRIGTISDFLFQRHHSSTRKEIKGLAAFQPKQKTVLHEDVFHRLVGLEARRTKRSGKAFVLMLLQEDCVLGADTPDQRAVLSAIIAGLSRSTRETDFLGWYDPGKVLGALFTEVESEKRHSIAPLLRAKITKALSDQVGFAVASTIRLTTHIPDPIDPVDHEGQLIVPPSTVPQPRTAEICIL
jgi:hypothetical protein